MGFRQLRDLAIEKRLLAESLVWKSGSDERVEARSILGLVPGAKAKVKQKIEVEPSEVSDRDPYCLLYTSPSPRDLSTSRMPSSA